MAGKRCFPGGSQIIRYDQLLLLLAP